MATPKILIAEDEIIIAEDIASCLEELGYNICAIDSGDHLIEIIRETQPDLLLLDIHLKGDIDGVELAAQIKQEFDIPFIFLTAYADKATIDRAKTTEPYGFIVKPFDDKDLRSAIEIALYKHNRDKERVEPKTATPVSDSAFTNEYLFVKVKHRMVKIALKDILWVEAYDNYSFIITPGHKYLISSTLKEMETKLPSKNFVRTHRSYIVNLEKVDAFEENSLIITEKSIPIGKSFRKELMAKFNII
ncbi:response regulator [Adhaeribacter sp. BT258]|uniref:Response regulator n=1 Tax=Adhaeribacter terrigena TaxID=2793070 RepID=A0ABS1BWD7_9BACT|nr:response regulator [Adhaeribacter terrigena]MBK0401372.1 response regulator [Adhaeribacter terrigena]